MNEKINTVKEAVPPVLTAVSSDTQLITEISEEFSLPDYIPEVRRILHVRAAVLPEGRFLSDKDSSTEVDFNGAVTYNIIYTDDEGRLRSTSLSSDYDDTLTVPSHPESVFIDTSVDNVSCRATAPRKLSIKTRLKSRILAFSNEPVSENISPRSLSDEMYLERKLKKVDTVSLKPIFMQNIKLSDKLDIPEGEDIVPIMCDASVTVTDCKARNESVSVRGSAAVKCLCHCGDKDIMLSKTVPIYEEPSALGASPSDSVRCTARCVSLSISNEGSSDKSSLYFDLNCEIEGEYYRNTEAELTEDCYSTRHETDVSYKIADIYSLISAKNHPFSVSDKFKRKDPDIDSIVDIICDAYSERVDVSSKKAVITGKMSVTVIGRTRDDESKGHEYISETYEVPLKYEIPVDTDSLISRVSFSCASPSARYENDKFCINADMICSLALLKRDNVKILDTASIKKDAEFKKDASCVRVFFPKDCDILWEVAKRFHTTERKIMEDNSLLSKSLEGVKSIII